MSEITTSEASSAATQPMPPSLFDFVGPSHCYSDPSNRVVEMARIKDQLKQRKITNVQLAYKIRKSAGWVGLVLLGNYPFAGSCCMPKNIALALEGYGIALPECFRWPNATQTPPSAAQLSYIARLCEKAGIAVLVPQSKAEASDLIQTLTS